MVKSGYVIIIATVEQSGTAASCLISSFPGQQQNTEGSKQQRVERANSMSIEA